MAIRLDSLSVVSEWATMIPHAAGQEDELLEDIKRRIDDAEMPGARCGFDEAQTGTMFAKTKRVFLICENEHFKDYRFFIGARSYGKHLNACWYLGCQPGVLKQMFAEHQTGDSRGFSIPTNILAQQELSSWQSVVHACVLAGVDALVGRLKGDPSRIRRESRGFLQVW